MRKDAIRVGAFRLALGSPHGASLEPGDASYAAEDATEPVPPPAPAHPVGLVDRERERKLIGSLLQEHRVVRVGGTPGTGTTTVLRQVAATVNDEALPDGSLYLHEAGNALDDILTRLYQLRFGGATAYKPLRDDLRRELAPLRALVAVDGTSLASEQLETFAAFVPHSRVVVADDAPPHSEDTTRVALPPVAGDDAIVLLEETLRRPIFGSARAAAGALCRQAGGNIALIRWLGATCRTGGQTLAEVANVLVEPEGLERLAHDAFGTLGSDERAVVSLLAAAGTGIHVDLIQAMTRLGSLEDTLVSLQRREVVVSDGDTQQLVAGIAPLVPREVATFENLEGVASALTAWLERAPGEKMSGQDAALTMSVLEAAFAASRWGVVIRVGMAASNAFALCARWDAWASALGRVQSAALASDDTSRVAWALHQLGARAIALGEEARTVLREAERLRVALRDKPGLAATRALLAVAEAASKKVPSAESTPAETGEKPAILRDGAYLDGVRKKLSTYIGLIAAQVVADAAQEARSEREFFQLCSEDLLPKERERFFAAVGQR